MSDTIRAFIAIQLPEETRSRIKEIQKELKSSGLKIKWVEPENIHLTLKFLGDVHTEDLETIKDALRESVIGHSRISISAKGLGVFPGINRPRVVWVGINGEVDKLRRLQQALEDTLEMMGFPREERPFRGHLTLARIKGDIRSEKLVEALARYKDIESEPFIAERIVLFKSELMPGGAVYTELMSAFMKDSPASGLNSDNRK